MRLDFTTGDATFGSETTVTFGCRKPGAGTFIEFSGPAVHAVDLNGRILPNELERGRIALEGLAAENKLTVRATGSYSRDGSGINWFRDAVDGRTYLHSMFSEHQAYRGYACFDQPDLKALFTFAVKAPEGWVAISNTAGARIGEGEWLFPATSAISTYITAIVAGEYHAFRDDHRGIPLGLYCRHSLAEYLDPEEIFEITRKGLDFFEHRFGYVYPFEKYDQLFVPEFASGAMENAGCVTHNERMVFRSKVTDADRMHRAETILHEMAHMWFGDLVTMRWWDDLWLNESFAEYMGYLGVAESTRFKTAWIEFADATKAAARMQDQLPTTHPIVADIPDVESVALNLDRITYNKGAAALRQLVAWVGEDTFFKGVEKYFTAHAYKNTDLKDFLAALEHASGRDLEAWSQAWLQTAGVNTLAATLEVGGEFIMSAAIVQTAPADHPTLRPHRLKVGLFDLVDGKVMRRGAVEMDIDGEITPLPQLAGEHVPDLLLVNDGDLTYCKIAFDERSIATLKAHLRDIEDPLARALAWGAVWDMARDADLRAREFIALALDHIAVETDAPTLQTLIARIERAVESYCPPTYRPAARAQLARAAFDHLSSSQPGSDTQLLWATTFIGSSRTPDGVEWVRGLLDGKTQVPGLVVDFNVRWTAVDALATIGAAGEDLIAQELARDPSDHGERRAAAARAAQPLESAKQVAWDSVVHDPSTSFAMKRAISSGFHRVDQQNLLRAFVNPYFECLLPVWESHDFEEAISIVRGMYPQAVITQEVVDATDAALAGDLPGLLRRSLLENQDGIKHALRAQAFESD
ncbi:MAG: aminopeptidase N [Candidatus Dormibacteraceae bacterium]